MTSTLGRLIEDAAVACRQLAREGHEDGNFAHLAVRDPDGRGLWMKRKGIGLSEVQAPGDFILLDLEGRQLGGPGQAHLEWPIHTEILRARSDVNATCHTHAFSLRLLAASDAPLQQLIHESTAFVDGLPRFTATSGLIDSPALGRELARALADARAVLIANHGAVVTGSSVAEMAVMTIALTRAVDAQIALAGTGWTVREDDHEDARIKGAQIYGPGMIDQHWSYFARRDARSPT